jgi:hypothetical protein
VFVTADFAKKLSPLTDKEIICDLMNLFCRTFKRDKLTPKSYKITRWDEDKFSLGSYTHFDVGSSM